MRVAVFGKVGQLPARHTVAVGGIQPAVADVHPRVAVGRPTGQADTPGYPFVGAGYEDVAGLQVGFLGQWPGQERIDRRVVDVLQRQPCPIDCLANAGYEAPMVVVAWSRLPRTASPPVLVLPSRATTSLSPSASASRLATCTPLDLLGQMAWARPIERPTGRRPSNGRGKECNHARQTRGSAADSESRRWGLAMTQAGKVNARAR